MTTLANLTNTPQAIASSSVQPMVLLQALASADRRVGATAAKTQAQFRDYKVTAEEGRQQTAKTIDQLQAALVASESQNRQLVTAFAEEREAMAKEKAALEDRLKALEAQNKDLQKVVDQKKDWVPPPVPWHLRQPIPRKNR